MELNFLTDLRARSLKRKQLAAHYKDQALVDFKTALEQALQTNPILIAPYTRTHPEHINNLPANFVRVPCPLDTSYTHIVECAYVTGKPIVIIEHDIVCQDGAVEELLACSHPWCGYPTSTTKGTKVCLGFVKLNTSEIVPDLRLNGVNWDRLDGHIEQQLVQAGLKVCVHTPEMEHVNPFIADYEEPHLEDRAAELMLRNLHTYQEDR